MRGSSWRRYAVGIGLLMVFPGNAGAAANPNAACPTYERIVVGLKIRELSQLYDGTITQLLIRLTGDVDRIARRFPIDEVQVYGSSCFPGQVSVTFEIENGERQAGRTTERFARAIEALPYVAQAYPEVARYAAEPCLQSDPPPTGFWRAGGAPGGEDTPASAPVARILSVSPNPTRGRVRIAGLMPLPGGQMDVGVFDAAGRRIAVLFRGERAPGAWSVAWDASGGPGARVASGTYFVRLRWAGQVVTRSFVVAD